MSKNLGYIWTKKEAYFWKNVIKNFEDIALSINELRSTKDEEVGISFIKTINLLVEYYIYILLVTLKNTYANILKV